MTDLEAGYDPVLTEFFNTKGARNSHRRLRLRHNPRHKNPSTLPKIPRGR